MDKNIAALAPHEVWKQFAALCAIPRPSGHETAVRDYLIAQGNSFGIECFADEAGNVTTSQIQQFATGVVRDALNALIEQVKNMDLRAYTDASVQALQTALQAALRILTRSISPKIRSKPISTANG